MLARIFVICRGDTVLSQDIASVTCMCFNFITEEKYLDKFYEYKMMLLMYSRL